MMRSWWTIHSRNNSDLDQTRSVRVHLDYMLAAVLLGCTKQSTRLHLPSSANGSSFHPIIRITCKNHSICLSSHSCLPHDSLCPVNETATSMYSKWNPFLQLQDYLVWPKSWLFLEWIIHPFLIIFLASPFTLCSLFSLQWPKRLWKISQIREEGTLPTI